MFGVLLVVAGRVVVTYGLTPTGVAVANHTATRNGF
jgi:hypothetical protein